MGPRFRQDGRAHARLLDALGIESLGEGALVLVDTAPIIYVLEGHPQFAARFAPLFARHEEGALQLAVTTVTLSEVLAGPLGEGEEAIARRYRVNDSATPGPVSRADFTRDTLTLEHYNKEKLGVFRRV